MPTIQAEKTVNAQGAVAANVAMFDKAGSAKCFDNSPHLKHTHVRQIYEGLVQRVFKAAHELTATPRVLDLGAGEGSAALLFLQLGADVTAVDISESQLFQLRQKCSSFGNRLRVCHCEIGDFVGRADGNYDIVIMNSFLHHIPDYLSLIKKAVRVLPANGQFFTFQDPLRYDSLGAPTRLFGQLAYFSWRLFQRNYMRGLKTRIRRMRGIYIPGSVEDDAEYHVTRNGVDQDAIADLLNAESFRCEIVRYFSAHSGAFQLAGTALGLRNSFGIVAQRLPNQAGR